MKVETKYEIGTRVWVAYAHQGEVSVHDDKIASIVINEDGDLQYYLAESCDDFYEADIVLYEDTEALVNKIKKIMNQIRVSEK